MSDIDEIARTVERARTNTQRRKNLEAKREYERAYYAKTIERRREKARERYKNEAPEHREARDAYQREYVKNNREAINANKARYREKNRDKLRAAHHAYIRNDDGRPNAKYRHKLKRIIEMRAADLATLAGRPKPEACEVCGASDRRIVFDHCHAHGHFRGWLCINCNSALGLVSDNAQTLRALAAYLDRQNQSTVE